MSANAGTKEDGPGLYRQAPPEPHPKPRQRQGATPIMTAQTVPAQAPIQALYTVDDATKVLRLSRAELYEQMRARRLRYVKVGRARRITARAIAEFVTLLETESEVAA